MTSDSSELSEPPSDIEKLKEKPKPVLKLVNGKLGGFKRKPSTPQSSPEPDQADLGREPSPPHEHVLADNPDIAVSHRHAERVSMDAFPHNDAGASC